MTKPITGLHHVTAIASDPQRNLNFYVGLLGLRLVKRTINFDDPGTYHLYFADSAGTPGTILTFFPWPGAHRGSRGTGQVDSTAFTIPPDAVGYWLARLMDQHVPVEKTKPRFNEEVIRFLDPDGMALELIASTEGERVQPWADSDIPAGHALRGFHSVTAALEGYDRTAGLLMDNFGYRLVGEAGNRFRFTAAEGAGAGKTVDLLCMPDAARARSGAGSVHHIAFRVPDAEEQKAWREKLIGLGFNVSPVMDRTYFHSIYFREPGGLLFEIATDPPGFTLDESLDELGTSLRLPEWLESSRAQIEGVLPRITLPRKEIR